MNALEYRILFYSLTIRAETIDKYFNWNTNRPTSFINIET